MPLDGYNKCLVNIKKIFITLINYAYLIIKILFVPLNTSTLNSSFPKTTDNIPHRQGLFRYLDFRYNFILKLSTFLHLS